jgi:hypothetical protein
MHKSFENNLAYPSQLKMQLSIKVERSKLNEIVAIALQCS